MTCLWDSNVRFSFFSAIVLAIALFLVGCDKSNRETATNSQEVFSSPLPKPFARLNRLKLTTSNFSIIAIIDGKSYELTDLVIDQTNNTISGKIEAVPGGNRSVQLEYYVNEVRVAVSEIFNVNVAGGKQNSAQLDADALKLDDQDGDGYSNLYELDAGTDFTDAQQAPTGGKPNVTPPQPTNLLATSLDKTIKLSWGLEGIASSYNIYYAQSEQDINNLNKEDLTVFENVNNPFIIPDTLLNNTEYHFYVASVNSVGESIAHIAAIPSIPETPAPPVNPKPIEGENKIRWDDVANAREYEVFFSLQALNADNYESLAVERILTQDTELTLPEFLIVDTKYYFLVLAKNNTGSSPSESVGEIVTSIGKPQTVRNIVATSEALVATISWDSIADVEYTVYIAKEVITSDNLANAQGLIKLEHQTTPITVEDLATKTKYYVVITATNSFGVSTLSENVEFELPGLAETGIDPPSKPTVTVSDALFSMAWNDVSNADSYSVYMAQQSGVTQHNAAGLTDGMTHKGVVSPFGHALSNGNVYYIVVTASDADGLQSLESTEMSVRPKAAINGVPNEITLQADEDQLTINWQAVPNAQSYNVYWSTTPDVTAQSGQLVPGGADTTNTSVTHTGLQNGQMYYYVVTAISNSGESEASAEIGAIPYGILPKPTGITATESNKTITLNWPPVPGAMKYHLYMASDASITRENVLSLPNAMVHADDVSSPFVHAGLQNDVTYFFLLTAVDRFGRESSVSDLVQAAPHTVAVNQPPEVTSNIPPQVALVGNVFNFQFASNTFSDPDQDNLTYTANIEGSNLPAWLNFDTASRTFSGTPGLVDIGTLEIDVIANDGNGGSITTKLFLTISNTFNKPIANNDGPEAVLENDQVTINVLENDLQANNPLNPATVSIISDPAHGIVTINANGSLIYQHDGSETTSDSFTYQVKDEAGEVSNEATVTLAIKPQNDPPQISGSPLTSVSVGANYSFKPIASDPDVGDTLNFSIANKPTWASFNSTTGELSGIADSVATTSSIVISVTDGKLTTSLPAFDLTVTGVAPIASDDNAKIIAAGNSVTINVLANDSDTDGTLDPSTVELVSGPLKGSASINPDGTFLYTSTPGTIPGDSFSYRVKDNHGVISNTAIVTIDVIPWESTDIGNVGTAIGGVSRGVGTVTVSGGGADIWGVADAFHYAYKPISGDLDVIARVSEIQNPQKWIKAGIMIRESLTPESKHANLFVTDNSFISENLHGVHFQSRLIDGDLTNEYANRFNGQGVPLALRLTRRGDTIDAYESSDEIIWKHIATLNIAMTPDVYVGLAVTSHTDGVVSSATFDNFSLLNAPITLPVTTEIASLISNQSVGTDSAYFRVSGLTFGKSYTVNINSTASEDLNLQVYHNPLNILECQSYQVAVDYDSCVATANTSNELYVRVDGSYTTAGADFTLELTEWANGLDIGTNTAGYDSETDALFPDKDVYTIGGSGKDIFGTADGFRFFYQAISGDVEIIAHVTSQQATNNWAKAGVMIRESTQANARFVDVVKTPVNGVRFQSRKATGGIVEHDNIRLQQITTSKRWVRLVRRGNAFDAYESNNGNKWLFLGTTNVPDFDSNALVGLAVTSTTDSVISESTMEDLIVLNGSGQAIVPEVLAGTVTSPQSPKFYVTTTSDKFFKVTGLGSDPGIQYTITMDGLSDDADLYVYSDEFNTLVCPTAEAQTYQSGTTLETCTVSANNAGELYIRVNGSYASFGSTFTLTVQ